MVIKAADTLQKNRYLIINDYLAVTAAEDEMRQRLVTLWNSFPDTTEEFEGMEEFLTRKSWLLKLLNPPAIASAVKPSVLPQNRSLERLPQLTDVLPSLPRDKQAKARQFAYAVRERGCAKGYASEISIDALALEFIHHAASWVPERLNCKTREEQIDAALSFAWRAAETGRWKCPCQWLNLQIAQREQEAMQFKNW